MRDMKQRHSQKLRERKQRHQNAGVETVRNGNCGTMLQGVENATQLPQSLYGQPKEHIVRL